MKDLLKLALLAGAAYLLLRPTLASENTEVPPAPGLPPEPPAPPLTKQPAISEEMIRKAAADPALAATVPGVLLNADEWNWYAQQATGHPAPDPLLFLTVPRETKLTAVQYWDMRRAKGLAGLLAGWR
jgi:hypothetical protein